MISRILSCALVGVAALSGANADSNSNNNSCQVASEALTSNNAGLFIAVLTQLGDNPVAKELLGELFKTDSGGRKKTFFVPDDGALQEAAAGLSDMEIANVLLTHVVEGQYRSNNVQENTPIDSLSGTMLEWYKDPFGVSVVGGERANVTSQDLETCAGPIHVIDAVLIPMDIMAPAPAPDMMPMMGPAPAMAPMGPCENIVDALSQMDGTMALVQIAGAVLPPASIDLLTAMGANTTIFAPPQPMLLRLLGGYQNQLVSLVQVQDILKLHIVPQFLDAEELAMMDGEMLMTLLDMEELTVLVETDGISVMSGNTTGMVTMADVDACSDSQVIHMIDMVLQPEGEFLDLASYPVGDLAALQDSLAPGAGPDGAPDLAPAPATAASGAAGGFVGGLAALAAAALAVVAL